jgi:para-aminobenzoate synthetase/4-amino-4-deoxychorismate lyase
MPAARFDDLRTGSAWCFPATAGELVAHRPEDVPAVLGEVERRTAAGAWAFGFVAYEAAPALDPGLSVLPPVPGLPLAWFGFAAGPGSEPLPVGDHATGDWTVDWDEPRHAAAVRRVRDHIAAGDTYQCNLTTRLTAPVHGDIAALYADLALAQRGAHNAFLDLGRFAVVSASPELFFELRGRHIAMRPMKGTAACGRTPAEDRERLRHLLSSDKERAENVMIVDLVRNDLARVARTGTVTVTSLCRPERYETVHQLTSGVTAELRPDVVLTDVFRALFPCGSVTGAPKRRTMELIAELEDSPRGVYCGAIGLVAPPDAPFRARFSVAIRTLVVDRAAGTGVYGAGGGITWSSDAAAEYTELLAKARILASAADARNRREHRLLDTTT